MEDNSATKELSLKETILFYYEKYMFAVGVFGQLLFFMQAIKIFQNESAKDVSLFGFFVGLISVSSWLIYGLLIKNKVLIAANLLAVLGALLVVVGILLYGT